MSLGSRMTTLAASALALLVVSCPGAELRANEPLQLDLRVVAADLRLRFEQLWQNHVAPRVRRPALLGTAAKRVRLRARTSAALSSPDDFGDHGGEWPAPSPNELVSLQAESLAAANRSVHPERALA